MKVSSSVTGTEAAFAVIVSGEEEGAVVVSDEFEVLLMVGNAVGCRDGNEEG